MDIGTSKKDIRINCLILGFFGALCLGSFVALWRVKEVGGILVEETVLGGRQPDKRKKVVAFVGVMVSSNRRNYGWLSTVVTVGRLMSKSMLGYLDHMVFG